MGIELVRAAVAANRDVPERAPEPSQDCRDVIHIAVFFDGTGNNKDDDELRGSWSNVARLYESARIAARDDRSGALYTIYISGVGTAFNGKAADWLEAAGVWAEDKFLGGGTGAGGDRRMHHGGDAVNERLRNVLLANAKALGGTAAKYATENGKKSFSEISEALTKHRLIKVINLSIFGFSRGAALARAFSNRLIAKCTRHGLTLLYHGYPLRINFMGLFDTVASFGVPAQNARTPFTERELIVSPAVERCVHYVAAHEVRFSFPVDLIRQNGQLAGNWVEKTFPGVHSDVGGGYGAMEQGVDNNYARIPMREMMKEALCSGVRMLSYEDLKNKSPSRFKERFECRPETEAAYASYLTGCGVVGGTVEQQIKGHMKAYYSANGTINRRGGETPGSRSLDQSKYKYVIGSKGMAYEVAVYRFALKLGKRLRLSDSTTRGFAQYMEIRDWQLAAWDLTAISGVVDFVSRYVHDSKVDFLLNAEPFSYFRPRGVEESSISVWQEGGNWLRSAGSTVGNVASTAAETGKEIVVEAADATAEAGKEVAEAAQRRASEAADLAKLKATQAAAAANSAYVATAKVAKDASDAAQQRAHEFADYASRKGRAAADAAAAAYDSAAKTGKPAVAVGKRIVEEVTDETERIYENGIAWVRRKIKET